MKRSTFTQFDLVQILTTRRVQWRCDVKGSKTDPNGNWSIVTTNPKDGTLLIQKGTALALVPASDVRKVANYDVESVFDKIESINKKFLLNSKDDEDVEE